MATSHQENSVVNQIDVKTVPRPEIGDEVVISGISGTFPNSKSVQEFMNNLYNEVDMVSTSTDRWEGNHPEVPSQLGVVEGMDKFDAQFFRVHYKQADALDPCCRKIMEHAYSAIFDAGINPVELRGKNVGVFVGIPISESSVNFLKDTKPTGGYAITGTNKSMYANRISYWLDAKGPSFSIDASCASSMICLDQAYQSIINGRCDSAIIGGCNFCLKANMQLNMNRIGLLSKDGKTKCFSKHGDGCARADAICVLFLQKAKNAKRIYAEVYHAKTEYSGYSDTYLPIRKPELMKEFLTGFYKEIGISPLDVEYVEACAPGIVDADRSELVAINEIFCKGDRKPLLVGNVKSNMGDSGPASGVSALVKICLAYETGELPANLHYDPESEIDILKSGNMQVVSKKTKFHRGFVALNNFSYTGVNVHVLLKAHYKEKNLERYKCSIPYLVTVSGRQELCVSNLLKSLSTSPIDAEAINLLHNIHRNNITELTCRGYSILAKDDKNETTSLSEGLAYNSGVNRPVWFVYSGMGSQWAGMGKELMQLPTFANTITRLHKVLEPKRIDLINILTNPDETIYNNILNSFVGISAVQIALTDILKELGIVPDNIIGHSVGELGCAYGDGSLTAEEMILSAYSRGLVSVQTKFIKGSMAAVGMGYKEVLPQLPPGIEVACHNSSQSCTISGPTELMQEFVNSLTSKGIFAKEVPCSNIAFHSKYIANAGPSLLKYLKQIITNPKPRSDKWLSTSVPQDKWNDTIAKYSSAEYHTNNLLNSVLFEETSKIIPYNAILIEIAPHGLLQAILKRSLPDTCVHIPLTKRGHFNPVQYFLDAIGKLYQNGLNPDVSIFYPKIEYPVSTGTPLLSQLVEWEHSENWSLFIINKKVKVKAASRQFAVSVHDDDHVYLEGHVRDGLNVYPEAGLLVRVWETLSLLRDRSYKDMSVTFLDVQFYNEAVLRRDKLAIINVSIQKGSQYFEVMCDDIRVASGTIYEEKQFLHGIYEDFQDSIDEVKLNANDVYTIYQLKGYSYSKAFQSIRSCNTKFNKALLRWDNEWTTFIDGLIQLNAVSRGHNGISIPKTIQKLNIDVKLHNRQDKIRHTDGTVCYHAYKYDTYIATRCAGVDLVGITFTDKPTVNHVTDSIMTQEFIPCNPTEDFDIDTALAINLQIVAENNIDNEINIVEIIYQKQTLSSKIREVSEIIPLIIQFNFNTMVVSDNSIMNYEDIKKANVIIAHDLLRNQKNMATIYEILRYNQFVLSYLPNNDVTYMSLFSIVSRIKVGQNTLLLLRKCLPVNKAIAFVTVTDHYCWIAQIPEQLQKSDRVVIVSEKNNFGLYGIFKKLKLEFGDKISLMLVDDGPTFNYNNHIFQDQINKGLSVNILKKEIWGGFYYIPTTHSPDLKNVELSFGISGDLDSFIWADKPIVTHQSLVEVHFAGVSLRDVKRANGSRFVTDTTKENIYGMDFSGVDQRGQSVMGIISGGAISSNVVADPELLWPVPGHWSLEEAATVPLAYTQALYCLMVRSKLLPNSRILIHGGAGAFGQACISIALAYNCTVFTTVSSMRKKTFLLKIFPGLKANYIGNSRNNSYEEIVMTETNGEGCDTIISCMEGISRHVTSRCTSSEANILLLGHQEMEDHAYYGAYSCNIMRQTLSVCISTIFKPEYADQKKYLQLLLCDGIAQGFVRPLTRVTYGLVDIPKAFRMIAASRQCGRILLSMKNTTSNKKLPCLPRLSLSNEAGHIVVCSEQILGLELTERLTERGAKKLLLHITQENIDGYVHSKLISWKAAGIDVKLSSENLAGVKGCVNLLQAASEMGPVEGIYLTLPMKGPHSMTSYDIELDGISDLGSLVLNLNMGSKQICPHLKYFVVFSCHDDTIIDSVVNDVCHKRFGNGLPALAVHYDMNQLSQNDNKVVYVNPQRINATLNCMETSLCVKAAVIHTQSAKNNLDYFGKIGRVLGVKEEIPENLPLEQVVGIADINIDEIINLLKKEFNLIYSKETLEKLTIAELKEIPSNLRQSYKCSKLHGLDAFINYVDSDEYDATQPIIPMYTQLSNRSDSVDDLDKDASYLMLIPGFEGHHRIYLNLCERLKIRAVTLQLEPDYVDDTLEQMSQRIYKTIRKRFVVHGKFYLLGYSFGVLIALEIAALFEKEGLSGTVFCLDSSPDILPIQLEAYVGKLNRTKLQIMVLEKMYTLMKGKDIEQLRENLKELTTWNEKVEHGVVKLRSFVNYSSQYKQSVIETAYRRFDQALAYIPKYKPLKSQLVLIKSPQQSKTVSDDYGLSKYSINPIKIFDIEEEHGRAHEDLRCSSIINNSLDDKVLEEYKLNYTCDIYTW